MGGLGFLEAIKHVYLICWHHCSMSAETSIILSDAVVESSEDGLQLVLKSMTQSLCNKEGSHCDKAHFYLQLAVSLHCSLTSYIAVNFWELRPPGGACEWRELWLDLLMLDTCSNLVVCCLSGQVMLLENSWAHTEIGSDCVRLHL